jgi:transposase
MDRAKVLQGLRMMKFEAMAERWEQGELSQAEAAEVLGMSERNFRRWYGRWLEEGEAGLVDRRIGRPSSRRVPETAKAELCRLYRERYADHTVKHFHEQLVKRHHYRLSYTVTKLALHSAGLVTPAARRGAHRKKRPRRPLPGMLLFQDASTFAWLPGSDRALDLVVTLDDATSAIYSAILVEQEGTRSSFLGLAETIAAQGLFCALYTDRGGHYFFTAEAGKVDKTRLTQVGRALRQLGIEHIASYSPEARGRIERVFRTLQDRLPKELRLAGFGGGAAAPADLAAVNRFLREVYVPAHNARFAVAAEQPGTAFVVAEPAQWHEVLAIQEERVVANDNTVRYRGLILQIPESPLRRHFVRATVRVHDYADGSLALFHGPRCIARFDRAGAALDPASPAQNCMGPRPVDMWTTQGRRPHPHRPHHNQRKSEHVDSTERSGQINRYKNRTT